MLLLLARVHDTMSACVRRPIEATEGIRVILKPFKGLGEVKFGMTVREVQRTLGIKDCKVTNKYLEEKTVFADRVKYVFIEDTLTKIDIDYQDGIHLNDLDLFNQDVDVLLKGYSSESRKDAIHVKDLGLVLFKFRLKDRKKRWIWCYSKAAIRDYEHVLDIV